MNLSEAEFRTLRETIAHRGTARLVLLPVTVIGWGIVAGNLLSRGAGPLPSLVALAVLAAGFEAIHALHVGTERIGRYIQVFYEGTPEGPHWETTAMAVGPALPGGGVDPLFTALFVAVTLLNALPPAINSLMSTGTLGALVVHAGLLVRVIRARGAATRQRAIELESYKAIYTRQAAGGSAP